MAWQLQEAKQRFSELVRRALNEGPQTVTRHGEDVVVVLAAAAYRELSETKPDLKDFLAAGPDLQPLPQKKGERYSLANANLWLTQTRRRSSIPPNSWGGRSLAITIWRSC